MDVPDPWKELAKTDLVLERLPIPELGRYYDSRRAIVVRAGLLLVEERAVLWHELVHARRRDARCLAEGLVGSVEESVDREAARWALPIGALASAMGWADSDADVADALKTTPTLLDIRRRALHPAERALLTRIRIARADWSAA